MKKSYLFATDHNAEETIVSESQPGSNQIIFLERIHRSRNEILYGAVATLALISQSPDFDLAIFKAMDKVCQMIYAKQVQNQ